MVLAAIELERRRTSNKTESVYTLPPKLTIEHVMPQKWREHWSIDPSAAADELTAARDAVPHRLGNLTLTSGPLNSSLSNAAWDSKRTLLHSHSVLLLNAALSSQSEWDVSQINERGFELALEICRIWPSPAAFGAEGASDNEPTLDEILAAAVAAAGTGRAPSSGVRRIDLLNEGSLEEGETLHPARTRVSATAVVLEDGRLECLDQTFDTPSAAAMVASRTTAENGWLFWLVERDGEFASLNDVRTQMQSATVSAAPETG